MTQFSVKDMKILSELDFDARQPVSQIAKKIGLSTEVTAYRIRQLEKKDIITGYYPVIDVSRLGYQLYRFWLSLENITAEKEDQFRESAKKIPNVSWFIVIDNCHLAMIVYAKTAQEAEETYEKVSVAFHEMIKSRDVSIAYAIHHFKRKYLYGINDDASLTVGGEVKSEITIDDIDKKLLVLLIKDARMKYTELASEVGLTSMAVLNRVKRMQKEGLILGFRCAIDIRKLGYTHHKIFLFTENLSPERKKLLKENLKIHPAIVYITEALGRTNLEFEMHTKTAFEVNEYLKELQEKFPEIKRFENHLFFREEIIRYMPE